MPEYIELFNNSGSAVDFACWEFIDGVNYKFPDFSESDPQNTFMGAFERILVTNVDAQTFRTKYTVPSKSFLNDNCLAAPSNIAVCPS